ncbi:DUF4240 domain-containing protein [uncultured Sphingomonas sp.]|uniref:DUF4240 domain-containing protein n=1 Tax=uncultured Sphingomonas sp. TaxID=158754 RepID=UPI0025EFAC93|nr:DUF4240 domain-containing protein [uncultured Sphingomonas sp.]
MGRILVLVIVAVTLATFTAYMTGAKPAKSGSRTPVAIDGNSLSRDDFWALIDHSATWGEDADAQLADLRASLKRLTPFQIVTFQGYFEDAVIRSYRWDLWGAAYVAKGGASDDGFEYFRYWLISRGRADFDKVIAHPDSLADLVVSDAHADLEFEAFAYVARDVWSAKTGQESTQMPEADIPAHPSTPFGTPFREDSSYLATHYPKLWKRFGSWL